MTSLYINLPVIDLPKATAFYEAIGFIKNPAFSNEQASGMCFGDNIYVMLLTHGFMQWFLPTHKILADSKKTCAVLNALELESKEAVDQMFEKAILAGAQKTIDTYDHGFMYGRDFEDLDGHIWELFWMDATSMPQA